MKLDIGCGLQKHEGYIGIDLYTDADIKAPMWDLPLDTNSVDAIVSYHALEHVPLAQVNPTLQEWYRVLIPGGSVVLQVPDFLYALHHFISDAPDKNELWAQQLIFGHQRHEGEYHRCGFTVDSLRTLLLTTGFILQDLRVVWNYDQDSIQAIALKPLKEEKI